MSIGTTMKTVSSMGLFSLMAGSLSAQVTINWGTGLVVDNVVQMDGSSAVDSGYRFELGTFGSFVPTQANVTDWAANWKTFDAITPADSHASDRYFQNMAFVGSDTLNADFTSSSSDAAPLDTFGVGEQAYVWVFNDQNIGLDTEWALYTQKIDGICPECLDGAWRMPDSSGLALTESWFISDADTAVWGNINDGSTMGAGLVNSSPASSHLQTAGFVQGTYWDIDGSTAGSGPDATPDGTWNAGNTNWNPQADGTGATGSFTEHSVATFAAGADATGAYTVVKEGSSDVYGLSFQEGNVTIGHGAGGAINFDRDGFTFHIDENGAIQTSDAFIHVEAGASATIETDLSGSENVTKTGDGTLTLSGTVESSLTGTITIEEGILQMSGEGTNPRLDTDLIIDGGTLLLSEVTPGSDNQFSTSSDIEFRSGLIQVGEANEDLGTLNLTLSADSTMDMTGSGTTSKIFFADSSDEDWSSSSTLFIENWDGTPNVGGGNDQIFFGSNADGLDSEELAKIKFLNPAGLAPGTYDAYILSTGEIVPFAPVVVPEPSTVVAGVFFVIVGAVHYVRNRKKVVVQIE